MARRRRSLFVLPVIVFACSIAGGFYGPKVEVAAAASQAEDLDKDVRDFSKVLTLVQHNFADNASADKTIYEAAIPSPHLPLATHSHLSYAPRDPSLRRD